MTQNSFFLQSWAYNIEALSNDLLIWNRKLKGQSICQKIKKKQQTFLKHKQTFNSMESKEPPSLMSGERVHQHWLNHPSIFLISRATLSISQQSNATEWPLSYRSSGIMKVSRTYWTWQSRTESLFSISRIWQYVRKKRNRVTVLQS
jgi:hypothetical protein